MFPVFIISLFFILIAALNLGVVPIEETWKHHRRELLSNSIEKITSAVAEHYSEVPGDVYVLPVNLLNTPGNETLRSYEIRRFQNAVAPSLNDGVWSFSRYAIWFEFPNSLVGPTAYANPVNNSCGIGSLTNSVSWCGRPQSLWARVETRSTNSELLMAEKQRLFRTIGKFYRGYSADFEFTKLAPGAVMSLANMTGYYGTAYDCVGVKNYQGIPLTCDDLFNVWGAPIVLNQITESHIVLVNRTGVINANGQPVRLAEEANLEL